MPILLTVKRVYDSIILWSHVLLDASRSRLLGLFFFGNRDVFPKMWIVSTTKTITDTDHVSGTRKNWCQRTTKPTFFILLLQGDDHIVTRASFDVSRTSYTDFTHSLRPWTSSSSNIMMDNLDISTSKTSSSRDEEEHHDPTNKPENEGDDKDQHHFRIYDGSNLRVQEHYRDMRQYQTVQFYRRMEEKVRMNTTSKYYR